MFSIMLIVIAGTLTIFNAMLTVPFMISARERRARSEELGDRIAEQAFHLDAAMHRLLTDLRAFDEEQCWAVQGALSCEAWLSWRVGWTPGTGREHVRVARALGALPRIDEALRLGTLSYSKVRAITRVATAATEEALLNDARYTTAAQLETICRKFATVQRATRRSAEDVEARRRVTRRERDDGMVVIEAVLPADEAAIVYAAIEREAARLTFDDDPLADVSAGTPSADVSVGAPLADVSAGTPPRHVSAGTRGARLDRAAGLVAMSQAVLRGDAPRRSPVEVVLTVSRDALVGRATDEAAVGVLDDGTCVAADTARRLACDCGTVELVEDGDGTPLSVGRRTRTIPAALRRALARRDATCQFPGCTNRRFLDGHHLIHWIHGGETSLVNLCRLCRRHHSFVHEHGYRVERQEGALVFLDPRGRVVHAEPPRVTRAPLGWAALRAMATDDGLAIDATTGASRWDGRPVDHGWVVDDLVYREYRRPPERAALG